MIIIFIQNVIANLPKFLIQSFQKQSKNCAKIRDFAILEKSNREKICSKIDFKIILFFEDL
jgi:hypothetical protein